MGLGADGSVWEEHVQAYEQHFRCILMDNRGAGLSDKPAGPYTTEMMADDSAGLMEALGIEQARVAGISMGGAIAQNLAIRHPGKVRAMVLVSTWARCDTYAKTVFEHFKKMRRVSDLADFAELLQLWIFATEYYGKNIEDLRQGQLDARENPMPQHAFEAQCDACITHNTIDKLQNVSVPALLTVGAADIFTPLAFSQELNQLLNNSEIMILPDVGHAHHWESLEAFNQKTTNYLLEH
jgi:pimeloyl-ACP methyl ester carboxylesterase